MLRLSKKIEYALIAMQYIAAHHGRTVPAKEIAEHYGISFEFVSKSLQALMRQKFIASQYGTNGGYIMLKDPHHISVAEVIEALDGKQHIVECCNHNDSEEQCGIHRRCTIKNPMALIQRRIDDALASMTIAQMTGAFDVAPVEIDSTHAQKHAHEEKYEEKYSAIHSSYIPN